MKKKIRVLPATVRIENIDLLEFSKDLQGILESVPELRGTRAASISLTTPKGTISMSYAAPDQFNLSGPSPAILDELVEAIKKHYETKTQ